MSTNHPTLHEIESVIETTLRRLLGDAPVTRRDIDVLRVLVEARPSTESTTATTKRIRGDAAAAKFCGYKSRRAFLSFTRRHRVFPIIEGRIKFWVVRDLERAIRGTPDNPAVWRAGRI